MGLRVLLTGAAGFVGSNFLRVFLEHTDWTFTCPVSLRHRGNPLNLPQSDRVRLVHTDLRGELPTLGPLDLVVNLASESHVDRSIAEPLYTIENNVSATLQVLEHARRVQVPLFIQFSTDEVFGPGPWGEYRPSNPYAASKACQEMCATAYRRTYGLPVVIANASNLIGRGQHKEKFVPKVATMVRAGATVPIHAVDGIPGRRHYTPVVNAALGLLEFVHGFSDGDFLLPHRIALGDAVEMDNLEMATLIASVLGQPLVYDLVAPSGRPGYDDHYSRPDGFIGSPVPQSLRECLEEALA